MHSLPATMHRVSVAAVSLVVIAISSLSPAHAHSIYPEDAQDDYYMHHHTHHSSRTKRSLIETLDQNNPNYWNGIAANLIENQLNKKPIEGIAKNIIMFLGDGMSIPTLVGARIYKGQLSGQPGEEQSLSFEKFPYIGLSKTYCVDHQVADSACSATAYLCGVKANMGTIGVTASVARSACESMNNMSYHVDSLASWAQKAGKSSGLVTTTRVTHASPAGVYAHTAERDWENDRDVEKAGKNSSRCVDIAQQLIYGDTGLKLNVILGGGRKNFLPKDFKDEEGFSGARVDNVDLIKEWEKIKKVRGDIAQYVWNREQLLNYNPNVDYLLGLFENDHMQYNLDANKETEPTLAEMTETAIKVLAKNPRGYFLFVEGGRIDHAHHDTLAKKALDETVQFSEAVKRAVEITNPKDTLIVVTSDHAHTMSVNGYPDRGHDILGIAGMSESDKLPYSTISYANGPGYKHPDEKGNRYDISNDQMADKQYHFPALAPLDFETHGGDDVGVFARGPWAHLLVGVYEQHLIPHVMAFASCIGNGITSCTKQ